ncbi:MAG: hypothetical protein HKN13_02540 [Rhodothermales bacterium]|nr:hypothetical protein [Rhodothermales bacterium]
MRNNLLVILTTPLLLLSMAGSAQAQSVRDGSIYSRFGFGELRFEATSQALGMGGGGTALRGARYTNFANPASFADQVLTSLSAGFNYETVTARDAADNTGRLSSGTLNFVQFSFPLKTQRVGVGFTFAPYSASRYRVRVENELITATTSDTTAYTIDYGGSGGLQQATFGVGIVAHKKLSVGIEGRAVFGSIEESQETNFLDNSYEPSILSTSSRYLGFNGTLGVLSTLPSVLRNNDLLTLGVTVSLPLQLDADRILTSGTPQERDTLNSSIEGEFDLPLAVAIGLSYRASAKVTAIADVRLEPWSNFSGTISLPGYSPADGAANLRNRTRISGGIEWIPAGGDALASYVSRIGYRFGLFYDQSYISPSSASMIDIFGVTGGFSLPTLVPGTRVDLNMEVGQRGTTKNGLVKDLFLKIGLNVNVGERWFLKRRLG